VARVKLSVVSEVALVADLDPVVDRPHDRSAGDGEHDQQPAAGEGQPPADVGDPVAEHGGDDDGDAPHRWGSGLGRVPVGHVGVDGLADLVGAQPVDQVAGPEE
jgi:hypothetical protein